MFLHAFTYNLKTILRSKESVFWSLLFPILLSTMFYFAFGNLTDSGNFQIIDIAVVESDEVQKGSQFYTVLSSVSDIDGQNSPDDLFHVVSVSPEEADELLKTGQISGYITFEEAIQLVVSGTGYDQSIIKAFLDEYQQITSTVNEIIKENPASIFKTVMSAISRTDYFNRTSISTSGMDIIVNFFYALLAMTCLMGSTTSVFEINKLQANQSALAARINVAPIQKFKLFLYNISAIILFQIVVVLIVLAYVMFILGIDFGTKSAFIVLTCIIGSIAGVFFGTAIGTIGKSEGLKVALTVGGTLFSSFLGGLMATGVKYYVQENMPLVSYLSPANLITDAFYSLYYYDDYSRFSINIIVLGLISALFCAITCLVLRRKNYASL